MRPAYWAAPAFSRRCRCSRGVLLSAPSPAASAVPSGSADTALASVAFLGSAAAVVWVLRSARASASVPSVSAGAALGSVAAVLCRAFQAPPSRQRAGVACTSVRAGCVPGRRGEGGSPVDSTPHSPPAVGRTGGTPGAATEGGRYAVEEGDLACGCSCRWCRVPSIMAPT